MKGKDALGAWRALAQICAVAAILSLTVAVIAPAAERIHIDPRYKPGDTLYYQIEMHTVTTGKTVTPIINPEGGTKFSQSVDLLVRLDVLQSAGADAAAAWSHAPRPANAVRMRLTYERAHADTQTDAPEFNIPPAGQEYEELAGRSFEFTLGPDGVVSNFQDLHNTASNTVDPTAALSWIKILATSSAFPSRGISVGQKWTSEQPFSSAPLAGLVWHTESTYLRDEPCRAPASPEARPPARASGSRAASQSTECAVILTQFNVLRRGSHRADQTPPDYVHHGLRTTGVVTGSGESLDTFSLESGLLVSSTESSTQRADFDIIQAANGERIHRAGQVQSQVVITRVAAPTPSGSHP